MSAVLPCLVVCHQSGLVWNSARHHRASMSLWDPCGCPLSFHGGSIVTRHRRTLGEAQALISTVAPLLDFIFSIQISTLAYTMYSLSEFPIVKNLFFLIIRFKCKLFHTRLVSYSWEETSRSKGFHRLGTAAQVMCACVVVF